jgi:hypothetical protein
MAIYGDIALRIYHPSRNGPYRLRGRGDEPVPLEHRSDAFSQVVRGCAASVRKIGRGGGPIEPNVIVLRVDGRVVGYEGDPY